ncbi:MAG: hypothetical protein WA691_02000 [Thermoplasmata archaeon]
MPGAPAEGADAGQGSRSSDAKSTARVDRVVSVPLRVFFDPDPDPTKRFPGQSADVEGYVVTPDHTITFSATASTPEGEEMLDAIWATFRRKGTGRRHMLLLDERGRTVSVMTIRVDLPDETLRLLRSLLVVPVRTGGGQAEIHLLATEAEAETMAEKLGKDKRPLRPPAFVTVPPARVTPKMGPGDWAFLGLLSSVGALDGAEGPTPELVAELFGVDPDAFTEQARAVERGIEGIVTGLFASPEAGAKPEGLPS